MENPSLLRLKNANSLKTPRISGCTNRVPTEMDLTRHHFREPYFGIFAVIGRVKSWIWDVKST